MKIDKIERENTIIFSPLKLREKHKILLFFTSREGGNSNGKYKSLNLGYHVEDDPENVNKNRDKVLNIFKVDKISKLFSLNQVHSDKILNINNKFIKNNQELTGSTSDLSAFNLSKIPADGFITNIPMIALMVTAADCNLILMADIKKRVVAAVHAGWKGILKKIELNAINVFKTDYGSELKDILVFIGPSIRKCCFKVTEETLNLFIGTYGRNLPSKKLKSSPGIMPYYFIDMVQIIKNNLINAGVPGKNISDLGLCTFCNEENLFFSYRKEKKTGRHAGIIMLE